MLPSALNCALGCSQLKYMGTSLRWGRHVAKLVKSFLMHAGLLAPYLCLLGPEQPVYLGTRS